MSDLLVLIFFLGYLKKFVGRDLSLGLLLVVLCFKLKIFEIFFWSLMKKY